MTEKEITSANELIEQKKKILLKRKIQKNKEVCFMSSLVVNIRLVKKCAFCKNWYDPTNSAIAPKAPNIGLWEIKDTNQKSLCMKKNIQMPANAFCSANFEQKM